MYLPEWVPRMVQLGIETNASPGKQTLIPKWRSICGPRDDQLNNMGPPLLSKLCSGLSISFKT